MAQIQVEETLAERLWHEVLNSSFDDWTVRVAALVIATLLAPFAARIVGRISLWVRETLAASSRLRRAEKAVAKDGEGIWLADNFNIGQPNDYRRIGRGIPVMTIANLKGGVGKTTIAANLLAHYSIAKQERVLAVDFDYQGSLSSMMLSDADHEALFEEQSDTRACRASHLIENATVDWLISVPSSVAGARLDHAKVIPSFYSLASTENRLMIEWLLGRKDTDVRFGLAELILSDRVQERYHRVIIDAPPRLTTACIQALAASNSVVIPTVLDSLSAQAVGTFVDQLRIHQRLWPHLRIAGVVGNMTSRDLGIDSGGNPIHGDEALARMTAVEVDAMVACQDALERSLQTAASPLRDASVFAPHVFIPEKAELSRAAGERVAYASTANAAPIVQVRRAFDRLGDEIDHRYESWQ